METKKDDWNHDSGRSKNRGKNICLMKSNFPRAEEIRKKDKALVGTDSENIVRK
jgi:hypothetical protein